jgi:hypothetical protein
MFVAVLALFGLSVCAAAAPATDDYVERVMDRLSALHAARAQTDSVSMLNGRVSIVGVGLDQLSAVEDLVRERFTTLGADDAMFTVGVFPATASRQSVLRTLFGGGGDAAAAPETRLRLAHNFVVEEAFELLDVFLSGLIEERAWESGGKQTVMERVADEQRLLHLALPALIPRATGDGEPSSDLLRGDPSFIDYEPLIHELLHHLEHRGAKAPLPTSSAALNDDRMWFAFLKGLLRVVLDTLDNPTLEQDGADGSATSVLWRNKELIRRLDVIVNAAALGAPVTAAASWVNAQNLHIEWQARLAVGSAMLDQALLDNERASIIFLVPNYLADTIKAVVSLHGGDARLKLASEWVLQKHPQQQQQSANKGEL